jgi:CubicO group peptidase (beta-lactamase class C family)
MCLRLCCLLLCLALPCTLHAEDGPSPDKLVGLWGSEQVYGPAAKGPLTLDGRGSDWQAEVAGFQAAVQHARDEVSFSLPGDQGGFRGRLSRDGTYIEGFWTQPAGITFNMGYATPLRLTRSAKGIWRGEVKPLPDRASFYLAVSRDEHDVLKAFLRNPEFNFGMRRLYTVTLDGGQVKLDDILRKGDVLQGHYDAEQDLLSITLQGIGSFDFTRRDRDHALGFYPVTPAMDHYAYRQPVPEDDGWRTASLREAGLDPKPLEALVQSILDTRTEGFSTPYIQGLLVAHHGKLALEEYFYGFDGERAHDSRSSGKTLAGTLTGIALDHGAKFRLDSPVVPLYPQYRELANPDPRKQKITVQDLLTMDSGLACDDNDDASPGNEDAMQEQKAQRDWYRFILDVPMQDEPGNKKAVYCTAAINLLGGVLQQGTGMALTDFFQKYYAGPLDIRDYHMDLMPTGEAYMGGGIYLKPRDMLKLGQLYLDGGTWNGKRVLSRAWTQIATAQHSYFPASDYAPGHGYGYTWHLFEVQANGHTYKEYMAQGNGGQLVMVLPELDLAVLITAGNYGNFPTWRRFFEDYVPRYLIPAAQSGH